MKKETTEPEVEPADSEAPDEPLFVQRAEITPVDSFIVMSGLALLANFVERVPGLVLLADRINSLGEMFTQSIDQIPRAELVSLMEMVESAMPGSTKTDEKEMNDDSGNHDAA